MSNAASAQTTTTPGLGTYRASCHCGALRIEADFDPSTGTTRCNCTICAKTGWWGILARPGAFRLVSGQEVLGDFSRTGAGHAHFCKTCGIRVYGHGDIPELGGEFYSINLNCLDGVDLSGVPVDYVDGLHDTWELLAAAPHVDLVTAAKRLSQAT
ncbi:aldehyde-activating protein [Sorangium cellulosum]|uniref:Aldehyde-activating protein n=1 Tax=Sorangium cellulosum TaxID=56 RepID=A0A150PWH3_SORCE|nr:aldehyde-activating protein [Sorangium cellulosum]